MANDFKATVKMFEDMAEMLEKFDGAVKKADGTKDAVETISAEMGFSLEGQLDRATPLSDTPEAAMAESKTKTGTKTQKLAEVLEKSLKKLAK